MKTNKIFLISAGCLILATGLVAVTFLSDKDPVVIKQPESVEKLPETVRSVTVPKKLLKQQYKKAVKKKSIVAQPIESEKQSEFQEETETVETLKEKISDIAVEYTDDIPLLDDLVQESASEPKALWEGDWVSIDDWKRNNDTFTVERNEEGDFELIPENDSSQSYLYNEETKEFEWVLDYYGKKITHKVRFISEDVMVLMKISGIKVALDIYKRDAG